MKSGKSRWSIVGLILWEGIALIDLGIDLYQKEITCTKLILMLTFCLLLAIFMYYVIRRRIRKTREKKASDSLS